MVQEKERGSWLEMSWFDQDDEFHRFSDYQGSKVLLSFLHKSSAPAFNRQAQWLQKAYERLQLEGGVVLGISDEDSSKLREVCDRENLSFILLSDRQRQMAACLGLLQEKDLLGKRLLSVRRSAHLFDEEGAWVAHCLESDPDRQADWWSHLLGWKPSGGGKPD